MLPLESLRKNIKGSYRNTVLSRIAGRRLKKIADQVGEDVHALVDLAFSFENNSVLHPRSIEDITIRPAQVRQEIAALAELVSKQQPKCVIEIGTNNGGTLFLWTRLTGAGATIVSVDLPGGPFGGGYPTWRIPFYNSFKKEQQSLHLVRGDSHEPATLERVRGLLPESSVDFLFIDGDHSYQGVKADFELFSPLVRPGGIVAFHDIVPHPKESGSEVDQFWAEVKTRFSHRELIHDAAQGWAGIGVVFMPEAGSSPTSPVSER